MADQQQLTRFDSPCEVGKGGHVGPVVDAPEGTQAEKIDAAKRRQHDCRCLERRDHKRQQRDSHAAKQPWNPRLGDSAQEDDRDCDEVKQ